MKLVLFLSFLSMHLYATLLNPPNLDTSPTKKCMFWSHLDTNLSGVSLYEPMGFKIGHYAYILNTCPSSSDKICTINLYILDINNEPFSLSNVSKCNIPAGFGYSWTYDEEEETMYLFSGMSNKGELLYDLYKVSYRSMRCIVTVLDSKSEKKPEARSYAALSLFTSQYGKYLILFGGFNDSYIYDDVWIFDLNRNLWYSPRILGTSLESRKGHSAFLIRKSSIGYIIYSMGVSGDNYLNNLGILKIQSYESGEVLLEWLTKDSYEILGSLPSPREGARISTSPNGYIILGGCNYDVKECYNDIHIVDIYLDDLGNRKIHMNKSYVLNQSAAMSPREQALLLPTTYGILILAGHNSTSEGNPSLLLTSTDCETTCNLMHGHFKNGKCECDSGWSGDKCDIRTACTDNCNNRGQCIRGVCECKGSYYGESCQNAYCKNNCSDKGECIIKTGICKCYPSYIGDDCSIKAEDNYSLIQFPSTPKNTTQIPSETIHTLSDEHLSNSIFSAVFYTENECQLNCRSRGACSGARCYCNPPYFGDTCEYTHCSTDCGVVLNRGICNHSTGQCECYDSFGGLSCEFECPGGCRDGYLCVDYDKCDCIDCPLSLDAKKCHERGVMIDGQCDCIHGYCGVYCENECVDCGGHGVYKESYCDCDEGFWGDRCQNMCKNRCSIHGKCKEGTCLCDKGWIGEDCGEDRRCPEMCNEKGWCNHTGECECFEGYIGKECETEICPMNCTVLSISYEVYSPEGQYLSTYSSSEDIPYLPAFKISELKTTAGLCSPISQRCECYPGYTGPSCDILVPCFRNCTDHGICHNTGECTCLPGYRGKDCSLKECIHGCLGNGVCDNEGVCQCYPGFYGDDCAYRCINNCSGHGECLNHECRCKTGYYGDDCSKSSECKMCIHGKCVDGVCMCNEGYIGEYCREEACECSNSGTSIEGKCVCNTGYTGKDCSLEKDCMNKCSGHGLCEYGKCYCEPGYTGTDCSETVRCPENCPPGALCMNGKCYCEGRLECGPVCANSCSGHGICNHHGKCLCQTGYYGEDCSHINSVSKCGKHGKDKKGSCECDLGWAGEDCNIAVAYSCPGNNCNGHGLCHMGICACDPDYAGIDCSIKKLCTENCSNQGVCKYGRCYCNPGYSGDTCSISQTENKCEECSGICIGNTCYCAKGDSHCSTFIESRSFMTPPICEEGCNGNGECINGGCECRKGYAGVTCNLHKLDEDIQKCYKDGMECSHSGMCFNGKCHCYPSFQGEFCQERIGCEKCTLDHQVCHFGVCVCESGWSGPSCEVDSACYTKDCGSHGLCRNGECLCEESYMSYSNGEVCVYKYNVPLLVLMTSIVYGILIGTVWKLWSNKF